MGAGRATVATTFALTFALTLTFDLTFDLTFALTFDLTFALTSITAPPITHGGWRPNRGRTVLSLGPGGGPHYGVNGGFFGFGQPGSPVLWRNDSNPASSVALGALDQPFLPGVTDFVSDGRHAYSVRASTFNEAFFDVYDLDLLETGDVGGLVAADVATLPLDSTTNCVMDCSVSLAEGRALAVIPSIAPGGAFADALADVLMFDVAEPIAPPLIARTSIPGIGLGGRVAGNTVLVVRGSNWQWFDDEPRGEVVVRLVLDNGSLRVDATLALERSAEVLWMDDTRAVVSTDEGVVFLTDGAATLAVEDELPLLAPPTDALATPDTLWLIGELGVVSVQPPCD